MSGHEIALYIILSAFYLVWFVCARQTIKIDHVRMTLSRDSLRRKRLNHKVKVRLMAETGLLIGIIVILWMMDVLAYKIVSGLFIIMLVLTILRLYFIIKEDDDFGKFKRYLKKTLKQLGGRLVLRPKLRPA